MSKKVKYDVLADEIVNLLGGKENIAYFTHCMTRLRFTVKDKSIVKKSEIEKIPDVVGSQWQGEQLQIIIGQDVESAYQMICKENNLTEQAVIDEDLDDRKAGIKQKFDIRKTLLVIVDCLAPLFPLLIGSSLVRVLCILFASLGWISDASTTYQFFYQASYAGMYYLPIFLGATAAKKFNANIGLGMLMGAMLLHPAIQTMFTSGEALTLLGLPVRTNFVYYANSIIPAISMVWVMSYIEKFFKRVLPNAVKSMLTPFLTIAIMIPLGFIIIGPATAIIGSAFSEVIIWFYNTFGLFSVGVFAALMPWLMATGMHAAVLPPFYFWAIATLGFDPITKIGAFLMNINNGVASIAVGLRLKDKNQRTVAISAGLTSILGGVSEPALFGFNLKYMKPMYAMTIGGLVGGLIAGLMGVVGYVGQNSILGLVTFGLGGASNLIWMCVAVAVGAIVTFILTLVLFRNEDVNEQI